MSREEAISILERVAHTESKWPGTEDTLEALDMAISALRQQEHRCPCDLCNFGPPSSMRGKPCTMCPAAPKQEQQPNSPLTMDELRKMDDEPVWVVYDEDAGMWALVEVCEESIFLTNNLGGRTEYAADVELEDDGITVYRRKPEEVQK